MQNSRAEHGATTTQSKLRVGTCSAGPSAEELSPAPRCANHPRRRRNPGTHRAAPARSSPAATPAPSALAGDRRSAAAENNVADSAPCPRRGTHDTARPARPSPPTRIDRYPSGRHTTPSQAAGTACRSARTARSSGGGGGVDASVISANLVTENRLGKALTAYTVGRWWGRKTGSNHRSSKNGPNISLAWTAPCPAVWKAVQDPR